MQKNYSQLLIGIIICVVIGLLVGKKIFVNSPISAQPNKTESSASRMAPPNVSPTVQENSIRKNIPTKVYEVLNFIRANNCAMDGYVGGRTFSNRERILPETDNNGNKIQYQEWDVNPKIQGQNRGTERLVTGSDGRAWFTDDHYNSFTEIK